jgi:hypothetical protein
VEKSVTSTAAKTNSAGARISGATKKLKNWAPVQIVLTKRMPQNSPLPSNAANGTARAGRLSVNPSGNGSI